MINIAKKLLDNLDPETAAKHSYFNYHARGVTYLNLLRTPELTVKLYTVLPSFVFPGFIVNPHNHAYDFHTYIVNGNLLDFTFSIGQSSYNNKWDEYDYFSENRTVIKRNEVSLKPKYGNKVATLYNKGDSYYHDCEDIHTIQACGEEPLVMLLFQYNRRQITTQLYSKKEISFENLYIPFKKENAEDVIKSVKKYF